MNFIKHFAKDLIACMVGWAIAAALIFALGCRCCDGAELTNEWPGDAMIFVSATWCKPCREQEPIVKQLADEGWPIVFMDADRGREQLQNLGVKNVPAYLFWINKRFEAIEQGKQSPDTLKMWMVRYGCRQRQRQAAPPPAPAWVPRSTPQPPATFKETPAPIADPAPAAPGPTHPNLSEGSGNPTLIPPKSPQSPAGSQSSCTCGGNCKCQQCKCDPQLISRIAETIDGQASAIEGLRLVVGDQSKRLDSLDSDHGSRLGQVESDLSAAAKRIGGIVAGNRIGVDREAARSIAIDVVNNAPGVLTWLTPWLLTAIGVGTGGSGALVALGLPALWRLFRGRAKTNASREHEWNQTTGRIEPVPPPIPASTTRTIIGSDVHHVHETEKNRTIFREVDNAKTDRAWAEATAIVVDRYPGMKPTAELIQRVKDQLLKGLPIDPPPQS